MSMVATCRSSSNRASRRLIPGNLIPVLSLIALTTTLGCDTAPLGVDERMPPPPADTQLPPLAGTYDIVSYDGIALPVETPSDSTQKWIFLRSSFRFEGDSGWRDDAYIWEHDGQRDSVFIRTRGNAALNEQIVELSNHGVIRYTGAYDGERITFLVDGSLSAPGDIELVYQRRSEGGVLTVPVGPPGWYDWKASPIHRSRES